MANSRSSGNSSSGSSNSSTNESSNNSNSSISSTNTSSASSNDTNSSSDTSTSNAGHSDGSDTNASGPSNGPSNGNDTWSSNYKNDQSDVDDEQFGHQKFSKSSKNTTTESNTSNNSTSSNQSSTNHRHEGSEQAKLKDDVNNDAHKFSRLESLKYNNPVSKTVRGVKNTANNIGSFAKQKGLKNKLKFLRQTKRGQKLEQKLYKIVKLVIKFRHVGFIGVILIGLLNLTFGIMGMVQNYGETLHYYCPIGKDTDPGILRSALYQQYCSHLMPSNMGIGFEELNGHYLIQTGSGPCTMTARANLWIRFFAKNDIPIYDYLFTESGDCEIKGVNGHMNNHSPSDVTDETFMRAFYDHGNAQNNDSFRNKTEKVVDALKANGLFQSGKPVNATMGYIRSEDLYEEYTDSASSENWVFYLQTAYIGDMGPTAADGAYMEINGVRGTLRNVTLGKGYASDKQKIIELLKEHPCGVICRVGDDKHSCTITGYDEEKKEFLVVDPAAYTNGGFEVLQSSPNGIWNKSNTPHQNTADWLTEAYWKVPFVTYIEEDTN